MCCGAERSNKNKACLQTTNSDKLLTLQFDFHLSIIVSDDEFHGEKIYEVQSICESTRMTEFWKIEVIKRNINDTVIDSVQ